LGRFEKKASDFYSDYVENNKIFFQEPLKNMSKLTHNLLCGIDYESIKKQRTDNFKFLHERLNKINTLQLIIPPGAFMYPLLLENGSEIRARLLLEKIYIPTLWPNVVNDSAVDSIEYYYAKNILPLPCDQRYSETEMAYLVEHIFLQI
jgi:hypothetical protein